MDEEAATTQSHVDEEVPGSSHNGDEEEEEVEEEPESPVSSREALSQVNSLLRFATEQGSTELTEALLGVKGMVEDIHIREQGKAKQKNITDLFAARV
jgi:hypothetical protein